MCTFFPYSMCKEFWRLCAGNFGEYVREVCAALGRGFLALGKDMFSMLFCIYQLFGGASSPFSVFPGTQIPKQRLELIMYYTKWPLEAGIAQCITPNGP